MTRLEQLRKTAQADANRMGAPLVILNLNRYNPLYVIRSLSPAQIEASRAHGDFVELITPQSSAT